MKSNIQAVIQNPAMLRDALANTKALNEPSHNQEFKQQLQRLLLAKVRILKQDDTVAMSADNLWQISVREIAMLPAAPVPATCRGSNCTSVARQAFDEVVSLTPTLKHFTTL